MENKFLPICKQDMIDRGWEQLDFVLVTGDAYVDHHSFGTAIISRVLENAGYKVGIIAQPDWKTTDDFMKLGRPRLGFLVSSGNMDTMVNHFSVAKKRRQKDAYSPGGEMGKRPDRATTVYCNHIRKVYKDVPIIVGGIEASLRRLSHYDYWSDQVKRSILLDSGADTNIQNNFGNTPIWIAKPAQPTEVFKLLLQFGADPTLKNKFDVSAIDRMAAYPEIIKILKREI